MSRPPQVKPLNLAKALKKAGLVATRQTGSHLHLKHPDGRLTSIAIHSRPIALGTLRAILYQVKITPEELKKLL